MFNARYLQPQINTSGLVAHWKLWDGFAGYETGNQVFDYSLNANLGSTTMIDYGSYPGYLFVDGSEIFCGDGTTIANIFDGGGSFSGWLKPLDQGQNNGGRVFDKSTNISVGSVLYCNASDTVLTFTQVTDGTPGTWTFPVDMTNGPWQHVVLTYDADATANNPIVYVNGESVAVTETSAPNDVRTSDAAAHMYIGTRSAGGRSWNGKMDDLMFFNRILSATEVKSIFSVSRGRYGV